MRLRLRRPRMDMQELQENWQPKLWIRLVVLAVVVGYAIAFVIENGKRVHVHFVLVTATVRLIWVVLLSLALGLVGGILLAQLDRRRRRRSPAE